MRIRQKMAQRQANVFTLGEPTFRPTHVPGKNAQQPNISRQKKGMVLFTMFQAAWSQSCKQRVKISLHLLPGICVTHHAKALIFHQNGKHCELLEH